MKAVLEYNKFKEICIEMAEKIREWNPTQIAAVCRGGLSAAHIITKHLNMKCSVFFPGANEDSGGLYPLWSLNLGPQKIVFIEDLIATGRTLEKIKEYSSVIGIEWKIAPVLIDANFNMESHKDEILTYGTISSDWIVMPYEAEDKVVEGDRGLFRDGTDQYGN